MEGARQPGWATSHPAIRPDNRNGPPEDPTDRHERSKPTASATCFDDRTALVTHDILIAALAAPLSRSCRCIERAPAAISARRRNTTRPERRACAAELDLLVQVHPCRNSSWPDYPAEERSRYEIWWTFGWEYDLSAFMARIVFGGVLERHPTLKLLIHHGGSMIPHFSGRVGPGWDQLGSRTPDHQREDVTGYPLSKRPLDYFRMFYADTALFGAAHALRCALEFFGPDRVLFGSDSPYDPEKGPGYIRSAIADLATAGLTDEERAAVFAGNVRRLAGPRLGA
jgi:hypothetical protein